ncbi:hypothetical protein ADIARSV_1345 [Arcticibacter svalbardensis MN12-7]|uniref:DUF3999 family protein n=1 Tax=Arcticibacter svalbardensis MN12-7 TaxID=1150600 RepID=R9GUX2_9SPHI|nr:DUF3999 family protein [Arcticibacter svalbardensis]EOR95526.1 hypothetical protein ADIARSV_1345 [Arcticibacter svalbardensis MN12-7]
MYKFSFTLVLITCTCCLFAQQTFKFKSAIEKVDSTAFYRIGLSPALLTKSDPGLSDIRLIDGNGKMVSFIYGNQLPVKNERRFMEFAQVKNIKQADSLTTFIVENKVSRTINQLSLRLRNTSAERLFTLSGSDDLSDWYAIKENVPLSGVSDNTHMEIYELVINFPANSYRYLKITVNNRRKEPVNILQAGVYQTQPITPLYTELIGTNFHQRDSGKLSKVIIQLNEVYPVNKISLTITGSKYFKRSVSIYALTGKQRDFIADTLLSSAPTNDIFITTIAKTIELVISNDDNPPLSIKAIEAFSLNQSIIGYLNKGQRYSLLFGDSLAVAPNYDLKFFADSVERNLVLLKTGNIGANPLYSPKIKADPLFPVWSIWVGIALVLAVLGLLTYRMVKEIDKKKVRYK